MQPEGVNAVSHHFIGGNECIGWGRESVATASTIYFLPPDAVQFHRRMDIKELDVTVLLAKRLAMDLLCACEEMHCVIAHLDPRNHAVECADREIEWTAVI